MLRSRARTGGYRNDAGEAERRADLAQRVRATHGIRVRNRQVGFVASAAAGALAGAAASGSAFRAPPVNRSSTERTASRVLRSLTASSRGAEAGERRIRLSGSGKIRGS